MVAAYALLLASAVAPAELDAAGLARVVAAQNGGQAVVALVDGRTILADQTGTADVFSFELKKLNVRVLPGPVGIAFAETLPDSAMPTIARLRKAPPARKARPAAKPIPAEALTGGKVTFASEAGTAVEIASLSKLTWSLPLVFSSAFSNELAGLDLAVSVKDLDETTFLTSIAKAIGGRFRSDGKNLRIEASGGELKARAIRTIDVIAREPRATIAKKATPANNPGEEAMLMELAIDVSVQQDDGSTRNGRRVQRSGPSSPAQLDAQLAIARAVTNAISSRDFEQFLNGELEVVTLNLAGSAPVQNGLVQFMRANATEPPQIAQVNRVLATVPPRDPGTIVLGTGFSLDANLNTVDRRGNAGRAIRLKVL